MSDTVDVPADRPAAPSESGLTASGTSMASEATGPTLRRIAGLLAPYKGQIAVVGLAVVASAALTSVAPFLTRAVFDDALFPADGSGVQLRLLGWLVAGLVAIPLLTALIGVGQTYLTNRIGNSAMADLRVSLFRHLQQMELAFFTSTRTGDIQSRLANDVAGVKNVLTSTATTILQNVVTVIAAFVSMVLLSWQLTLITLVLMPIFVFVQIRVGKRRQRLAKRTQQSLAELTAITEESLGVSGILLAKVFNRSDAEVERYARENRRQTRLQLKAAMTGQTFFSLVSTFFGLTPAIIYLVAGYLLSTSNPLLTAGTVIAFTTLQSRLQMPLVQLMRVTMDVQTSLALFRRLFEYLDLVPAIQDRPGARVLDPGGVRGDIEFRDVWFRYPEPRVLSDSATGRSGGRASDRSGRKGRRGEPRALVVPTVATVCDPAGANVLPPDSATAIAPAVAVREVRAASPVSPAEQERWALQGISMRVHPGQVAALVGPSGSGKTTLTYLVPRLHEVTRGAVLIDGVDVRDVTLSSLSDAVGMVTQEPYLFHGTIADNLRYAKPGATDAEVVAAAIAANIHDRIMSFEQGYETITGERGFRLSGGEKQRLSIARVLLMDPKILILDEATSALDTATERLVQEALERAMSNRTTLAIAHRLSTIMNADVIFGIEDGRLVESGSHEQLLARGGLYARLYAEQFGDGAVEARFDDSVQFTDGSSIVRAGHRPRADMPV